MDLRWKLRGLIVKHIWSAWPDYMTINSIDQERQTKWILGFFLSDWWLQTFCSGLGALGTFQHWQEEAAPAWISLQRAVLHRLDKFPIYEAKIAGEDSCGCTMVEHGVSVVTPIRFVVWVHNSVGNSIAFWTSQTHCTSVPRASQMRLGAQLSIFNKLKR